MNNTENKNSVLFELAEQDKKALEILLKSDVIFSISCFHAQQAVEKYMKAVLRNNGIPFPFTHDLIEIWYVLNDNNFAVPVLIEDIEKLNPFAVKARYDEPPKSNITREEVITIVNSVAKWCKEILENKL